MDDDDFASVDGSADGLLHPAGEPAADRDGLALPTRTQRRRSLRKIAAKIASPQKLTHNPNDSGLADMWVALVARLDRIEAVLAALNHKCDGLFSGVNGATVGGVEPQGRCEDSEVESATTQSQACKVTFSLFDALGVNNDRQPCPPSPKSTILVPSDLVDLPPGLEPMAEASALPPQAVCESHSDDHGESDAAGDLELLMPTDAFGEGLVCKPGGAVVNRAMHYQAFGDQVSRNKDLPDTTLGVESPLDRVVRPTSDQQLGGSPVYGFVGSATFRCIAPFVRADFMFPGDRAAMAPVSRISRQFFHGSFSLWDPRHYIGDAGSCTYRCVSASVYRYFLWPELSVYLQQP